MSVLPTRTSSFMLHRHALLKHSSVVSPHGASLLNLQRVLSPSKDGETLMLNTVLKPPTISSKSLPP